MPLLFSPLPVSSWALGDELLLLEVAEVGADSVWPVGESTSFWDPELPNILFSKPPWEEMLLRLPPATL